MSDDLDILNKYTLDCLNLLSIDDINNLTIICIINNCSIFRRLPDFMISYLVQDLVNLNTNRWQDFNCLYKKRIMLYNFSQSPDNILCNYDVPNSPKPSNFPDLTSPKKLNICGY
jgi:hypothetical protein